ncbi:MAG TPA: hypothetical protein PLZ36_12545, partial [Armatimonadota bacterium]|nr:hypothetical protein [Armatimonadota bacterium]
MRMLLALALILLCVVGYVGVASRRNAPVVTPPAPAAPTVPMTHDFAVPVLMYHRVCELTPREARSPL